MPPLRILVGDSEGELPFFDRERFDVKTIRAYAKDSPLPHSISGMLTFCPSGWTPEVYLHGSLAHFPLPTDIEGFEGLTAANIEDWHRGGRAISAGIGLLDLILGDRNGLALLRAGGLENGEFALFGGIDAEIYRALPEVERDIDLLFVGSLDITEYEERNRWVERIARLSDNYKIVISPESDFETEANLMSRAKIVFLRSANGGLTRQTFRAAACGSLLFLENDNFEAQEIFKENVHAIYYNAETFDDLLKKWLVDDAGRTQIAEYARRLVLKNHTEAAHQNAIYAALEKHRETRSRPSAQKLEAEQAYEKAFQIYTQSQVTNLEVALTLLEACEPEEAKFDRSLLAEARGATYGLMAHSLPFGREKNRNFTTGILYAKDAIKKNPRSPFTHLTFAFLLLHRAEATQGLHPTGRNDVIEAAVSLSTAAELCEIEVFEPDLTGERKPLDLIGFGYPHWNDVFDARLDRAYLIKEIDPAAWREEVCRTLAWRCRSMLSDLSTANGQNEEALRQAQAAVANLPNEAEAILRLARCEALNGQLKEAALHYFEGLQITPLSVSVWSELVSVLTTLGLRTEAEAFVSERLRVISAIPAFERVRLVLTDALKSVEQSTQ